MRGKAKSFKVIKGTNLNLAKNLTEDVDYLQYLYDDFIEHGEFSQAIDMLKEKMFYE